MQRASRRAGSSSCVFPVTRESSRLAELGPIEPGKLADLVILDADPLADIANTGRIHRVVKGGEVFDPEEILARALRRK